MKNVLIIGPIPEPTTGVSLANKVVLENLSKNAEYNLDSINTSYNKFDEDLGAFSLSKFIFFLKLNFFAYKIFKADIVYITPGQTFFGVVKYAVFIILSTVFGKDLITHIHGNHAGKEYSLLKGLKKRIFKLLLSKTSKGIVLSESLTGNMSPFIERKNIYVLYNFVEDYLFPVKEEIDQKIKLATKPKVVFLSNLMQEKGIFDLLEALILLEVEGFDYEAKIAGNIDAKHKQRVEDYFKKLKNVQYVGLVSGQEKKDLLLWGNVFVLPTFYKMEGQPISILEAMATGNLILTTKHAGIPDIFTENTNGFFVKKQDAIGLAETIKATGLNYLTCNKMRKHNFLYASKNYKVNNFINNFVRIIES